MFYFNLYEIRITYQKSRHPYPLAGCAHGGILKHARTTVTQRGYDRVRSQTRGVALGDAAAKKRPGYRCAFPGVRGVCLFGKALRLRARRHEGASTSFSCLSTLSPLLPLVRSPRRTRVTVTLCQSLDLISGFKTLVGPPILHQSYIAN